MKKLVLNVLCVFLMFFAVAQENNRLMPLDVAKLQRVASAKISEDGNNIAYLLYNPADPLKENKPASVELHIYRVNGKHRVPFITRSTVSNTAFRPAHQSITFLSKMEDEETQSLYEIPLSGGEAVKLFSFKTSIINYNWGPGGEKIVFIAKDEKKDKKENKLPYQPNVYEEDLSWQSAWVASVSNPDNAQKINLQGNFHDVIWSPAGNKLAVALAPTPLVDDRYMKQSIHIVNGETLNKVGSVEHKGKLDKMAFSPDGTKLAFIGGADIHDPTAGRMFVVSAEGGEPKSVQPGYKGKFEDFVWKNDQALHFISSKSVWSAHGTVNADGSAWEAKVLKDGPVLTGFDQSDNGTMVFTAETPEHPTEVYLMKTDETSPQRI
ncbi:MAG TPA: hypothetical protein VKA10_01240, partial [Prolixibacteraceae bacterium]|nr:hypothetical protein [Prolixibacteraceae bacterium]